MSDKIYLVYPICIRNSEDIYLIAYDFEVFCLDEVLNPSEVSNWIFNKKCIVLNAADNIQKHALFRRFPLLGLPAIRNDVYDPTIGNIKDSIQDVKQAVVSSLNLNINMNVPLKQQTVIFCGKLDKGIIYIDQNRRVAQDNPVYRKLLSSYHCYIVGLEDHVPLELKFKYIRLPMDPACFFSHFCTNDKYIIKHQVEFPTKPKTNEFAVPTWLALKLVKIGVQLSGGSLENEVIMDILPRSDNSDMILFKQDEPFSFFGQEAVPLYYDFASINRDNNKFGDSFNADINNNNINNENLNIRSTHLTSMSEGLIKSIKNEPVSRVRSFEEEYTFIDPDETHNTNLNNFVTNIPTNPQPQRLSLFEFCKDYLRSGPKFTSQIRSEASKILNLTLTASDINKVLYHQPSVFAKTIDGAWELKNY